MVLLNVLKIVAAVITVIIAISVGIIELRLNPENMLNRWFFLFFMSGSLGFLAYTTYHLILFNSDLVIPIMVTAHLFFNFIPVSLVMTVFIIEKYKKIAMSFRYLGTMMIIFILMSFGYFIPPFKPSLSMNKYSDGIVDTTTPLGWFLFVNVIRIALSAFVVYKYAKITRTIGEETKKRVQWCFSGILLVIIALFINLVGGWLRWIPLEIIALFTINIGSLLVLKGFLL